MNAVAQPAIAPRIAGIDEAGRGPLAGPVVVAAVVFVEVDEIDRINIYHATLAGMRRALEGVRHAADLARIDGNAMPPGLCCPAETWIGGDARDRTIMAASILAKVCRDRHMLELHERWPCIHIRLISRDNER